MVKAIGGDVTVVGDRKVVVGLGTSIDDVVATIFEFQAVDIIDNVEQQVPGSDTDWSFTRLVWVPMVVGTQYKWVKVGERPATEEEASAFYDESFSFEF